MKPFGLFIGGAERCAEGERTFAVTSPETAAIFGHAARASARDAEAAVTSAARAFPGWANASPEAREAALLRGADAIERRRERLIECIIDESGSTITKARHEVNYAATLFRAAAGESRRLYGETMPNDRPTRMSFVVREPLGVVVAISPFNAPLALLAKMVAFPLAAGNTVVAKPSEETPIVAIELASLLFDAGLPAGVLNVVTGFGSECGTALVHDTRVRGIAFTGSTDTGRKIGAAAVDGMRRFQLELGGKNALLVLADADPVAAAAIAVEGAFTHAGQICMASSRVIVDRAIGPAFAEAFARQASELHLGDLRDERTAYGPLIHEGSLRRVAAQVDAAVDAGARLLTGGSVLRGLVYRPTVLLEPPKDSGVWREETFGPVASVRMVSGLDEAIAVANDSAYGLSAGILTRDIASAFGAARKLRSGSVHIGMHSFQSNAMAPIGGYGMSGIGRSGGRYSVDEFTESKWISVEVGALPHVAAPESS